MSAAELQRRAEALTAQGLLDEAILVLEAAVRESPQDRVAMHNLAAALGDAGRCAEGTAWARRAINAGLQAPETWLVLGRCLAAERRPDEAVDAFEEALRRKPDHVLAQRDLAQVIWMQTGDRGAALQRLDRTIAALPQSVELRLVRSQVLGHVGDADGAHAEALAALQLGGGRHPQLLLVAANTALAAGCAAEGLAHARAAAGAAPQDGPIAAALVRALLAVGDAQEAAQRALSLQERTPLDQNLIALLTTAWRLTGDERHRTWCDYEQLVVALPLACPRAWPSAEQYVDALVESLDRHHHWQAHPFGQSLRGGSQLPSIDHIADPVLKALRPAVEATAQAYLQRIGAGTDPLRRRNEGRITLQTIWSVRLATSGHHVSHVHPQGWVSSACHLRSPDPADASDRRGWLAFGEPGVPTQPALPPERFVRPQRGVMVFFPSYLWHGTVPFDGPETRLTFAADLLPGMA